MSNRTRGEGFFDAGDPVLVTADLNRKIEGGEHMYNQVRPHQELDYLTLHEYYCRGKKIQKIRVPPMSRAHTPQAFMSGDEWHPGTKPAPAGGVEENQA